MVDHQRILRMEAGERGHFAAHIASAWLNADSKNKARLEDAFPNLFPDSDRKKVQHSAWIESATEMFQELLRTSADNDQADMIDALLKQLDNLEVPEPGRHIIVHGNPIDGLHFIGPFPDEEAALREAEEGCTNDWWLGELEAP